jgi:hypothetical protein
MEVGQACTDYADIEFNARPDADIDKVNCNKMNNEQHSGAEKIKGDEGRVGGLYLE